MTMVPAQTVSKQQQQQQQQQQQHSLCSGGADKWGGRLVHSIINHDASSPLLSFGPSVINTNKNYTLGLVEEARCDPYLYHNNSINHKHLSRAGVTGGGLIRMAEEEEDSATNSTNETGSTSNKAQPQILDAGQGEWLRLGIGGTTTTTTTNHSNQRNGEAALFELGLLPGRAATTAAEFLPPPPPPPPSPPIFIGRPSGGFSPAVPILFYQSHHPHNQLGWANYLSRAPQATMSSSPSSSSSSLMQPAGGGGVWAPSFLQPRPNGPPDVIRLVDPPPRAHSGIWFMLQPSLNQSKEPFLPQLPKSYLRIKDGRMTVRLLTKYLANKLGLESESQVEIRCRGEGLQGNLTLQQVRDDIWSGREAAGGKMMTLLTQSSTADHVMVLHYARSSSSSN